MLRRILCSVVVLLLVLPAAFTTEDCTPDTTHPGCKASCKNTTLDIQDLLADPATVNNNADNYTFSCLSTVKCPDSDKTAAVCKNGKEIVGIGMKNVVTWTLLRLSPLNFTVEYAGGDCKGGTSCLKATIVFTEVATEDSTTLTVKTADDSSTVVFQVSGMCVGQPQCGFSNSIVGPIGLAVISLSFVVLISYFIIGALVMYFARGARGVEVIPNVSFWKDFPLLLKDGMLFTISPCRRNRDEYSSL